MAGLSDLSVNPSAGLQEAKSRHQAPSVANNPAMAAAFDANTAKLIGAGHYTTTQDATHTTPILTNTAAKFSDSNWKPNYAYAPPAKSDGFFSDLWSTVRDPIETAAVLVGNTVLPGSSLLTSNLASKGSQNQLNSPIGNLAQIATSYYGAQTPSTPDASAGSAPVGTTASTSIGAAPIVDAAPAIAGTSATANAPSLFDAVGQIATTGGGLINTGGNVADTSNSPWWDIAKAGVQLITGDNGQVAANQASANAANSSAAAADKQAAIAQDQWNTYKEQYSPVNTQLTGLATAAGSPAQIEQEGAIAGANATQQAGLANAATVRNLQRSGVNPNSGNALAVAGELANNDALARTGAINTARKTTQDAAFAKTLDTVNAGNHVASNATAGLSSATAGLSAASNANALVAANAGNTNANIGGLVDTLATSFGKTPMGQRAVNSVSGIFN